MNRKTVKSIIATVIIVCTLSMGAFLLTLVDWQQLAQSFARLAGLSATESVSEVKQAPSHEELTSQAELWGVDTSDMTDEQINAALKGVTGAVKGNSNYNGAGGTGGGAK